MPNFDIETKYLNLGYNNIVGVDEVGLGCLSGPVFSAAVILPINLDPKKINDSKKLTPVQRNNMYDYIKENALAFSISSATVKEIDELNVYQARFLAVRRAIDTLNIKPDFILMDGNAEIPNIDIPQETIIKGDTKSLSIAAASILAKVERDRVMVELAGVEDIYDWRNNKGYGTKKHTEAIKKYGINKHHRKKFVRKFV